MEEEVGGGGDEENESSKSFSDLTKSITILGFTLNVFFFFTDFFFLLIPKLKKNIYWKLTAAYIEFNRILHWQKLKVRGLKWKKKNGKLEIQFCIFAQKQLIIFYPPRFFNVTKW